MDPSIVNYLSSVGQPSDYASRAKLAASKGITGYVGSAQQNTQLLNMLRGGAGVPPPPTAQPQQRQQASQPQQQQSPMPTSGGSPEEAVRNLMAQGLYGGWDFNSAVADYKATGGQKLPNSGASGVFNQPTIDLPSLYQGLYDKSGISDIEKGLSEKSRQYNEAVAKIKDNPYLSEATMSGRLRKIDEKFNADTQSIRNDIATRKADIETQLNLQTKQFDIKSQQATQALNQFNSLLQSGAFDNASGEDIANITRSTGLSSSSIRSAIEANKAKNVQTQTMSFDDGSNSGFVTINARTGEVLNKQIIGASQAVLGAKSSTSASDKQAKADQAIQVRFEKAISDGIKQLQSGSPWGEVWNRIKTLFPDAPPELIDSLLGTGWREPGAYQNYLATKKGL